MPRRIGAGPGGPRGADEGPWWRRPDPGALSSTATGGGAVYELLPGRPVAEGVRDVAAGELDLALAAIHDVDDRHEAVHEARKRCKKVRALVRLVRDDVPATYRHVNTTLRDAARLVSISRDVAAAVETHVALERAYGEHVMAPYAVVGERLVARRDGEVLADLEPLLAEVGRRLARVRGEIDEWRLPAGTAVETLRAGYARTYGRALARWHEATTEPSTHGWHQWRKRVKYHRHHVELLRRAWPPVMELREDLLHELSDHLGEDHDLAELRRSLLVERAVDLDGALLAGYVGLADRRRAVRQRNALPLAARLLAEPVEQHSALVARWWTLATDEDGDHAARPSPIEPVIPRDA